jgi:hypothetical protein
MTSKSHSFETDIDDAFIARSESQRVAAPHAKHTAPTDSEYIEVADEPGAEPASLPADLEQLIAESIEAPEEEYHSVSSPRFSSTLSPVHELRESNRTSSNNSFVLSPEKDPRGSQREILLRDVQRVSEDSTVAEYIATPALPALPVTLVAGRRSRAASNDRPPPPPVPPVSNRSLSGDSVESIPPPIPPLPAMLSAPELFAKPDTRSLPSRIPVASSAPNVFAKRPPPIPPPIGASKAEVHVLRRSVSNNAKNIDTADVLSTLRRSLSSAIYAIDELDAAGDSDASSTHSKSTTLSIEGSPSRPVSQGRIPSGESELQLQRKKSIPAVRQLSEHETFL